MARDRESDRVTNRSTDRPAFERRPNLSEVVRGAPDANVRLELCVLLRLAVCLNRNRSPHPRGALSLAVRPHGLEIRFGSGWLDEHPLTRADLEQEAERLRTVGFELRIK